MYYPPLFRIKPNSFVRMFHASPNTNNVDIYANDKILVKNLPYRGFSEYLNLPSGNYNIKIFSTGEKTNPILDTTLTFGPETIYTVAIANTLDNLYLIPYIDPIIPSIKNKAYLRFTQLALNTPKVDITLPNGEILFQDVYFGENTNYIPLSPGTYTLQIRPSGTSNVALTIPNIQLKGNKFYTMYSIGILGKTPPLQVVIPLDGNTYIHF